MATLAGYAESGERLLTRDLIGNGETEVTLSNILSSNVFDYGFDFSESPAPLPEPATLTLLGIGLAATGWHARRARARRTAQQGDD